MTCIFQKDQFKDKKHWEALSYHTHEPVHVEDEDCGYWICDKCGALLSP